MNIWDQAYADSIRDFLNKPPFKNTGSATMYGFDEDREYGRMLEANHDDLMDQLKHAELSALIVSDYDLYDGDLLPSILTAGALWDGKPESAFERMKVIRRLTWLATEEIAESITQKEFDDMTEKL